DISSKSRRTIGPGRFLYRADDSVTRPVCLYCPGTRPPASSSLNVTDQRKTRRNRVPFNRTNRNRSFKSDKLVDFIIDTSVVLPNRRWIDEALASCEFRRLPSEE